MRGLNRGGWLLTALALVALAPSGDAGALISSASTSGSTCSISPGNDANGSTSCGVAVQTNTGTTLTTRFAGNVNADVASGTRDQSGGFTHKVSFTATAPVGYLLTIGTSRVGDVNRLADDAGCNGSASIGAVTGSSNIALTSGTLGLGDPSDLASGGTTADLPFSQSDSATICRSSFGVGQAHALTFTFSGSVRSNSCEAAVRVGASSGTTTGCSACGYPGSPSRTQSSDGHFATVTFTELCGNGTVDTCGGEQCDEGAQNGTSTSCCTSTCQFRASGQTCRISAGVCDVAETCTGASGACPADGFQSTATECRASGGVCDVAENCTGSGASCPADAKEASGTTCRASAGSCDVADVCDGASNACPADAVRPSGFLCNPGSGDACDPDETCDGSSTACPADTITPSGTTCRTGSGDSCDPNEACTGAADAPCPGDVVAPSGTVCNAGSGDVCDPDETCSGAALAPCPGDTITPSGTVCNPGSGDSCDPDEVCSGAADAPCPGDTVAPSGTVCDLGSGDVCDPDEVCSGAANAPCPTDTVAPGGTVCNPGSGDSCDPDEVCSGTAGQACPTDTVASGSTVCRATAGACDIAETCPGAANAPCPADAVEPASTQCRADAGQCDVAESCDGVSASCPADGFVADGLVCDDGDLCTENEECTAGVCGGGTPRQCIDHFKCYKAKDKKNPKFQQTTVQLTDQFFGPESTELKKPYLVCNPVDKNGEGINNPSDHLTCYKAKGPKFLNRPQVEVVNQLGTTQLELKKTFLMCAPSSKTILP